MLRRAIRRVMAYLRELVFLAPVLALLPAAVLDIGPEPESRIRFSLFPLALALLDPLVWTCIWNSLAVAGIVALGSLLIGVAVGGLVTVFRFWGRPALAAMIIAPAIVSPAFLALGILGFFWPIRPEGHRPPARRDLPHARRCCSHLALAGLGRGHIDPGGCSCRARDQLGSRPRAPVESGRGAPGWCGPLANLVDADLAGPASIGRLGRLPGFHAQPCRPLCPSGSGPAQDPGLPWSSTALSAEPFPRLASMALIVLAITLAGRSLVWWRGDRLFHSAIPLEQSSESPAHRSPTAGWPRATVSFLILVAASCWPGCRWEGFCEWAWLRRPCRIALLRWPGSGLSNLLGRLTTDPAPGCWLIPCSWDWAWWHCFICWPGGLPVRFRWLGPEVGGARVLFWRCWCRRWLPASVCSRWVGRPCSARDSLPPISNGRVPADGCPTSPWHSTPGACPASWYS